MLNSKELLILKSIPEEDNLKWAVRAIEYFPIIKSLYARHLIKDAKLTIKGRWAVFRGKK